MEASKGNTKGNKKGSSSTKKERYASSVSSMKETHEHPSSSPTLFSFERTHSAGNLFDQGGFQMKKGVCGFKEREPCT